MYSNLYFLVCATAFKCTRLILIDIDRYLRRQLIKTNHAQLEEVSDPRKSVTICPFLFIVNNFNIFSILNLQFVYTNTRQRKLYAVGIKVSKAIILRYGTNVSNKLLGHLKYCNSFKMATILKIPTMNNTTLKQNLIIHVGVSYFM